MAFREKSPIEEMLIILREVPNPSDGDSESAAHNPLAIEVFSQTLFMLGSKSLTHAHAAISKYQPIFKLILDSEEAQLHVLKAAYHVWKLDTQMMAVAVDMLLKYQVVECAAVANWVFMKEMKSEFTKIYLWEILHLTIRKMNKHVTRLATELSEAREKLRRAEMNSSDSEDNEDGNGNEKEKEAKDVPTEEQVDKMEEKLEAAQADQKNLFLIVFQRFIMILSEHIALCDTDGINFNNTWYRWTIGRLQQVFMQHAEQVAQYSSTLETLLFTQDLDKNILEIFHQFQALRA
ncbi:unnamed protein product [Allacma fusca]|uniref:MIF4G-like type 2 domain-containing protein n=1 Tax=Allacma fusca TaxID=39272 RepID=A0A8J2JFJ8_9HEXA|nr:unnamed protein product [Allacma fusca]